MLTYAKRAKEAKSMTTVIWYLYYKVENRWQVISSIIQIRTLNMTTNYHQIPIINSDSYTDFQKTTFITSFAVYSLT